MSVSLMSLLEGIAPVPPTDVQVDDLTLDSRETRAGSVFFALRGRQAHGLTFAAEAIARGACAILWESESPTAQAAPTRQLEDTLRVALAGHEVYTAAIPGLSALLGRIADRFFGQPSAHVRVTAITGTNGKTTCAYLLTQALQELNVPAAYIGTIGWGRVGALRALAHTTPDVINVHRMLAHLRAQGVREVAMEVSSHALDQGRVDAVRFHTAAFTNLTRDHLDYHGTMEAYGAAKGRLFATPGLAQVVFNVDDAFGRDLARGYRGSAALTSVWVDADATGPLGGTARTLHATDVRLGSSGISVDIAGSFGALTLDSRLLGRFNAENALVVLACIAVLGITLEHAVAAVALATPPPGRMEVVAEPLAHQPLTVVDYAHTPDALAKALGALREHCRGELWCVFGCGGDRDAGKRPMMGAVVDQLADAIIVTDDNPRSEDAARITDDILAGIRAHPVSVIHDRAEAIGAAISRARGGDVVLIAGKGHEDYQIYGRTRRSFSDRREARRVLGAAA